MKIGSELLPRSKGSTDEDVHQVTRCILGDTPDCEGTSYRPCVPRCQSAWERCQLEEDWHLSQLNTMSAISLTMATIGFRLSLEQNNAVENDNGLSIAVLSQESTKS